MNEQYLMHYSKLKEVLRIDINGKELDSIIRTEKPISFMSVIFNDTQRSCIARIKIVTNSDLRVELLNDFDIELCKYDSAGYLVKTQDFLYNDDDKNCFIIHIWDEDLIQALKKLLITEQEN